MTIKDVKRELSVWAAVLLSAAYSAVVAAKPMDFEESKKIPRLKEILASVSSHGRINVSECRDIEKSLSCSNGVVVSLATWIVAQSKDSETNLYARIEANGVGGDLMSRAFARMSPIWKTARHDESRKNLAALESFLKESNPYLRIEAAKEIQRIDSKRGERILKKLLSDESIIVRGEAFRQLDKLGRAGDALPELMPDEEYELLLSIIEK